MKFWNKTDFIRTDIVFYRQIRWGETVYLCRENDEEYCMEVIYFMFYNYQISTIPLPYIDDTLL